MNDARKRRFDVVLVWRFDRCARSTKHLILALEEFRNLGIDFISFQENIDTSSPLGGALFTIISAVAQLERDIIAERVRAGLRRAKENGQKEDWVRDVEGSVPVGVSPPELGARACRDDRQRPESGPARSHHAARGSGARG